MPLIDPARLITLLGAAAGRFDVDNLAEIDSTNSELLRRAADGAPAGSVLVADVQIAGRGRRGRQWLSQPGASLTFSLLWRFADHAAVTGLSLAVGVAIARALENLGVRGVGLKWPNDVLLAQGKLAGVLVELQSDARGVLAVIGIGINLEAPQAEGLLQPASGLGDALAEIPETHRVLAELLKALAQTLDSFEAGGFAAVNEDWRARHAWQHRQVRVLFDDGSERSGICLGADDDGALLLETARGIERLHSGDVSLRVAA